LRRYFFTAGEDEVRAWTVKKGSKAPEAAGRIHGDMERGFIMAETMKFEDLKELGTEAECKAKGKYTQNGKNYLVQVWIASFHPLHAFIRLLRLTSFFSGW
jgi:obg-like ATPase 1